MDKALNYLSLARKAGRVELGEEPVAGVARAQKARLILVASDASDHTWRRAKSFAAGTSQQCIRVPFTKDALGQAIGRSSLAIAAFTDPSLALAFVQALETPGLEQTVQALQDKTDRIRQRQSEEKAHQRNKRLGKAPRPAVKK